MIDWTARRLLLLCSILAVENAGDDNGMLSDAEEDQKNPRFWRHGKDQDVEAIKVSWLVRAGTESDGGG